MVPWMVRPRPAAPLALALLLAACPDPDKGGDSASDASTTAATSGATTGAASEPTTTGAPQTAECQQDSDCMIVDNCCECSARPVGAEIAPCPGECLQSTCDAKLLSGVTAACRSGVCEFANVPCSAGPPACATPKPSCPPDTQTSVVGDCWGPCVPSRYCEGAACTAGSCGDGWMCVEHQATASACAPIPHECAGTPDCTCAAPYLDEFCPGACAESGGGLLCMDGG